MTAKIIYPFDELVDQIKAMSTDTKIPTQVEIKEDKELPSLRVINRIFKENTGDTYTKYFNKLGYEIQNTKYNFEKIKNILIDLTEKTGLIPTYSQIETNTELPDPYTINEMFKRNRYNGYTEYLLSKNYIPKNHYELTYSKICKMWDDFFERNNFYPKLYRLKDYPELPSFSTLKRVCGDKFIDFKRKYFNYKTKEEELEDYHSKVEQLKSVIEKEKSVPSSKKLNNYGLPSVNWFLKRCPDETIKTYSDFIRYLNYIPNKRKTKEDLIPFILTKKHVLQRSILYNDFKEDLNANIGRIIRLWGTFNNMLTDLGLEINQENMVEKSRDIETMKGDIISLCNKIYKQEGRKNISKEDIDIDVDSLNSNVYNSHFKKELNMTLGDFISSIGFIPNKAGMGMIYKFEDGEISTSKYEFDVSNYFRDKQINYKRNVKYSTFIEGYIKNKDCDYVVISNNHTWYVEVAGMLKGYSANKDQDYIKKKYKEGLDEKERMLQIEKLNYKIIYPKDIEKKPIDEVFSFLFTNK